MKIENEEIIEHDNMSSFAAVHVQYELKRLAN